LLLSFGNVREIMKTSIPTLSAVCLGALLSLPSCSTSHVTSKAPAAPRDESMDAPKPAFEPMRMQGRPRMLTAGVPFRLQALPTPRVQGAEDPMGTMPLTPAEEYATFDHPLEDSILVRTTAYCQDEADHIPYGNLSAAGNVLKYGDIRSAAADWSKYPVGTRFRIISEPGVIYQVDDYGSALVGSDTIDLYRPTMGAMDSWGVRNVDIEIIEWGSFEDSLRLMEGRTKYRHVRRMVDDIQNKTNQTDNQKDMSTTPETAIKPPMTAQTPGSSLST